MPVYDELERKRQGAILFWLTVLWLTAAAYFLTSYYTVDLNGSRQRAHWNVVGQALLVATAIYALLCSMTLWRWPAGRRALFFVSLAGTVCLMFLAIGLGVLFVWIWNPWQYLCLVFAAFAVFRLMRRCQG